MSNTDCQSKLLKIKIEILVEREKFICWNGLRIYHPGMLTMSSKRQMHLFNRKFEPRIRLHLQADHEQGNF